MSLPYKKGIILQFHNRGKGIGAIKEKLFPQAGKEKGLYLLLNRMFHAVIPSFHPSIFLPQGYGMVERKVVDN